MTRRIISGIMLALLSIGMLMSTFKPAFIGTTHEDESSENLSPVYYGSLGDFQPPPTEWDKTYSGTLGGYASSVIQTVDGGYALAGSTYGTGGGSDFWLVKTDAVGEMLWSRTYGGADSDSAYSIVQTTDGGYAIAGITNSFGAGLYDFWLVKTDADGYMVWNKTYGGTDWDYAESVIQTSDGGYAIAGWTEPFGAGVCDFWLVKTNSAGDLLWNRTYGGANNEQAYSVVQAVDGGYVIGGMTASIGFFDFWLLKINSTGDVLWSRTYGGADSEIAYSMVQTSDGGYALAGDVYHVGVGRDFWLVKTDADGYMVWNKTYGGTGNDEARSIVQTTDGGYAIAGITDSFGAGLYDFWLVKTGSTGAMVWSKTYGGTSWDYAESVIQTSDGGYALAGGSASFDPFYYKAWLIKIMSSPDIAITDVTPSKNVVGQGATLSINVTVQNQAIFTETFSVTAYYDNHVIQRQTVTNLLPYTNTTLTFNWNTAGVTPYIYLISAKASIVPGEIDINDNTLADGTVCILPLLHDVAIIDVYSSPKCAYYGEDVNIYVYTWIWNRGSYLETFNVTAYADENSTIIGDEVTIGTKSLSLPSYYLTSLTFIWNTTGVTPGNYTISAVASNVTQEADLTDNLYVNGRIQIFASIPCYEINTTSPTYIELNPSIFQFDQNVRALKVSLGNMTIDSTGYEGRLRVLGSTNGSVHLRVDQPSLEYAIYNLPENGSIQVPLWLIFDPGTYSGTYELQLTVCGVHRLKIIVDIVHMWICENGNYSVAGGTATFNWTVTGGSLVYLEAQPDLPPGWSFTVDPPIGTLFETPHQITVNITAASDAKEGDIGSVTLRAYKNATNILIWQYTFFSSIDSLPPIIEAVQPPTLTFDENLLFNATVKDASGIEGVQLHYSVNDGPWNNQSMQWSEGDTFNSTSYTLTVPHVPDNSTIKYYIVATDWLRNQTQSDIQTLTVKYDLAITEVKTSKAVVGKGFPTQVNVTIANQGTLTTTSLKIAVYANTTLIHVQTIPYLTNGTAKTLTFNWNTTNIPRGNYTITAYAIPILDETDKANNICAKVC